jgi:lipoate-protein ligase A
VIRLAVKAFGIDAIQSGRNDILAKERKFSGNAFHRTADVSLHHGTILISSDLSKLSSFLAPSPEKLEAKGVESVRARVLNLCELNSDITPVAMRGALLLAFAKIYGVIPKPLPSDAIDPACLDALTKQYAAEDWRLGRLSAFTYELRHRFSFGELEFLLEVSDGMVKTAHVHSDAMDADWVEAMKAAFAGRPFSATELAEAVPDSLQEPENRKEVADYLRSAL